MPVTTPISSEVTPRIRSLLRVSRAAALTCAAVMLLGSIGCSSTKTHVESDRVQGRTFSFVKTGSRPAPDYADNREEVHRTIQAAITRNLAAKGVQRVEAGADLRVAYLVVVGNNAVTTSLDEYFGYREEKQALIDKTHAEQTSRKDAVSYFESGTLVVDVLDAKTSKLLHRSSVHSQLLRNLQPEARAERVQSLVDQALANVRLSP